MESDYVFTTYSLESVDSTQTYLINAIKSKKLHSPVAVYAKVQTAGLGSRGNVWITKEGNLYLSFAIEHSSLPSDLRLESSSIYFSYLLKEILTQLGSKVWLKWPNDFYIGDKKIGGVITNMFKSTLVCGIGLNVKNAPEDFEVLDIDVDIKTLVETFLGSLKLKHSWKQIFSKYALEFERNRAYFTHVNNSKIALDNAILEEDGSITCNGQRIYSLR